MGVLACIDGVQCESQDAKVSIFDRGFLYGDSAFEVLRTYGGVPFAQAEHLARLRASCERLLIAVPVEDRVLCREIASTLEAAKNEESYVRVMVTRGSGPLTYDPGTATNPLRVIVVSPLAPQPEANYRDGIGVVMLRASRPSDDRRARGVKASNYLASLLAIHEAKQRGGQEAVLLGPGGEVLEGATSNVFIVRDGRLRTPSLEACILAGITRAQVIAGARTLGVPVDETTLFPRDLYEADEVFITSSLREVVPVVRVDDQSIGDGRPGGLTRRLHEAFLERVRGRAAH